MWEIRAYELHYYAGGRRAVAEGTDTTPDGGYRARIALLGTGNERAALYFYSDRSAMPSYDRAVPNIGHYRMYFMLDSWEHVVDLLRNEKPLFFRWRPVPVTHTRRPGQRRPSDSVIGFLSTSEEEQGEGETPDQPEES